MSRERTAPPEPTRVPPPRCPVCDFDLRRAPWGWICPNCGYHPT